MWRDILLQIHINGVQVRLYQIHYNASASHPQTKVSIIQPIPWAALSSEIFSLFSSSLILM